LDPWFPDVSYKEVRVKSLDSHAVKALLVSRALLVKIKRDLENQIRGLLKNRGFVAGRAKFNVFAMRAKALIAGRPELTAAIGPLLKVREAIERQVADLDRKVLKLARNDDQARTFMTVPGVGPITALCFRATIDDQALEERRRGKRCPYRDGSDGEIVRFFASAREGDREFNIDPPASSYAIMRRARPLPRREPWARQGSSWRA
jgi:transposase